MGGLRKSSEVLQSRLLRRFSCGRSAMARDYKVRFEVEEWRISSFFFFFLNYFPSLSATMLIVFWTIGCHLSTQFAADKLCDRREAPKNSVEARDEWEVSPWNSRVASTDWIQCLFSLSLSSLCLKARFTDLQNVNLLVAVGLKSFKSYSRRRNKRKGLNFGFHILHTLSIYIKEIRKF